MGLFDNVIKREQEKNAKKEKEALKKRADELSVLSKAEAIRKSLYPFIETALNEYTSAAQKIVSAKKVRMGKMENSLFKKGMVFYWGFGWSLVAPSEYSKRESFLLLSEDKTCHIYDWAYGSRPHEPDPDYHYWKVISREEGKRIVAQRMLDILKRGAVWPDPCNWPSNFKLDQELVNMCEEMDKNNFEKAVYYLFSFSLRIINQEW